MRLLAVALAFVASCGGAREPGWTLEGEVLSMETRLLPKTPEGHAPRQELVVQVAPLSVSREGTPRPESEWAPALSEHRRRDNGRYEFSITEDPLPAVLPAGSKVRLVLDADGYVVAVEPLTPP